MDTPAIRHRRHWYNPTSIARSIAIRPRLYYAVLVGTAALLLLPRSWPVGIRGAVTWDLSAAMYLALAFRVMLTCTAERIRAARARQDDSGVVILVIILLAITASFVAIGGVLVEARTTPHKVLNLGLAAITILLFWTITQVVFTLHYAHEYYRPGGGLDALAKGRDATSRVNTRGINNVVARATPAKPRLVDPQILFVSQAPKLLRAEASVAAQFTAKVRLVGIASFGCNACPVHTRLGRVRSQQQ